MVYGTDPVTIGLSSFPRSCQLPSPPLPEGCPWWSLEVTLPLAMLVPGPVALSSPNVQVFAMESGMNGTDPNDCWGGGGNVFFGDVAIASVTAAQVVVALSNVDPELHDKSMNGSFVAARCP